MWARDAVPLDRTSFFVQRFPLPVKIDVGPEYFFKEVGVALNEEHERRHTVQYHPGEQYRPESAGRQILEQHAEIVTEIQVNFLRTVVRQRSAADMEHRAARFDPDPVSGPVAPASRSRSPPCGRKNRRRSRRVVGILRCATSIHAPDAQNTSRGASYCPRSDSIVSRIRPRQNG